MQCLTAGRWRSGREYVLGVSGFVGYNRMIAGARGIAGERIIAGARVITEAGYSLLSAIKQRNFRMSYLCYHYGMSDFTKSSQIIISQR